MQLILSTRYTRERLGTAWIGSFYKARYFRLFPVYIAAVGFAILANLTRPHVPPLNAWHEVLSLPDSFGNLLLKIYLALANATMFFQDAVMFIAVHGGQAHWSANFLNSDIDVWRGIAVPPTWSLGVELTFYLIAPFILHLRSRWIIVLALLGLTAKLTFIQLFDLGSAWTFRFVGFEICYFLFGALACRYRHSIGNLVPYAIVRICAYTFVVAVTTL